MSKTGTYWDKEGKYQEQYDAAWKQLIPTSGEADDGLPEALRAISRIGYDYYNNGFCNLWRAEEVYESDESYYDEYKMDSHYEDMVDYLRDHTPHNLHKEFRGWLKTTQGYCNWADNADIIDRIISHIMRQIIEQELIETEALTS